MAYIEYISTIYLYKCFTALLFIALVSCEIEQHVHDHSHEPYPAGTECKDNSVCYSHLCYIGGSCAPDGPVKGTVAGGGTCSTDSDCFSNYCFDKICVADSSARGKVAGGGFCISNEQCYSGTCIKRRCGPDSPQVGKMAAGAPCEFGHQCYSGSCSYLICAPDGPGVGLGPGGGFCSTDSQCSSGVCMNLQCSAESHTEMHKVSDGARCHSDENCQTSSRCLQAICTPRDAKNVQAYNENQQQNPAWSHSSSPQHTIQETRFPAGAFCTSMSDCQTACVFGRCAPPSRWNPLAVADGGPCVQQSTMQGQCKSGRCEYNICASSYSDRIWASALAAGVPCNQHHACFSGYCANGKCSSDSHAPLPHSGFQSIQRNRGQVAGGGLCQDDTDCYSGYCDMNICGPDGPRRAALAGGAVCTLDRQCFANYCYNRRCTAPAMADLNVPFQGGKVAPGGSCNHQESCSQGSKCENGRCKALDQFGQSVTTNLASTRPIASSVPWNGTCWHGAQCVVGQCLEHKCTVPWYLVEKYSSSASWRFLNFTLFCIMLSILFR